MESSSKAFNTLTSDEFAKLSDSDRMAYLQASMADLRKRMEATNQLIKELVAKNKR